VGTNIVLNAGTSALLIILPLTSSRYEWKEIIHFFLMELGSNSIYEQTGFELRRVFRPLNTNRVVTIKDIPEIFSVNVDVDDIYGESEWKNKRKKVRDLGTKRE
jgi:hypothetical protein